MKLKMGVYNLLTEATRRLKFNENDLRKPMTEAWTGLGTKSEYNPCLESGFMTFVSTPRPRVMTWWTLTDKGARVVSYWLGMGYDHHKIEGGECPPIEVPDVLVR